jgi:hypothetical protein
MTEKPDKAIENNLKEALRHLEMKIVSVGNIEVAKSVIKSAQSNLSSLQSDLACPACKGEKFNERRITTNETQSNSAMGMRGILDIQKIPCPACLGLGTKEAWYEKQIEELKASDVIKIQIALHEAIHLAEESAKLADDRNKQIATLTAENEQLKDSEQDTITSLESDRIKQRDEQRKIIASQQSQIKRLVRAMTKVIDHIKTACDLQALKQCHCINEAGFALASVNQKHEQGYSRIYEVNEQEARSCENCIDKNKACDIHCYADIDRPDFRPKQDEGEKI